MQIIKQMELAEDERIIKSLVEKKTPSSLLEITLGDVKELQ